MAKIVQRRPMPQGNRPKQEAHPAVLGKVPVSRNIIQRRPKGKSK
jgi:hypothetical protein